MMVVMMLCRTIRPMVVRICLQNSLFANKQVNFYHIGTPVVPSFYGSLSTSLIMGLLNNILGKKNMQRWFERLHNLSLKGMNYGRAADYKHNGESAVLKELRHRVISSTAVLFDVGANQGVFSRHLLESWQGMNYHLYVFEPSKNTFSLLVNSLPERSYVHLINKGLGAKEETTELYFDKAGSALASLYPRDLSHHGIDFSEHETISLTTLDLFCSKERIMAIDFLKLDVEGHELAVLEGGKKMFEEGRVRIVQFEFGGCNIDSRTFFRDYYNFFARDFDLFRILSNGLQPIEKYSEKLEIFQSANYLAIKKV